MMKAIMLSIGLISTINASSQRLLQQSCGTNEVFSQCNGHCRPTCATGPNIVCTRQCQAGCNCADGYILDETDGTCILESDCPSSCGANEEYNQCGSACPASCDSQSPGACIAVCVAGCFCSAGYIRDSNGRCILESECPVSCGTNEVFSPCSGHCRPTCETGPNIICTLQCQPGCNCADGYILDQTDGTCIPDTQCPSASAECPLRCESGFIGCNNCFCDGLGGPGGCTKIGCPAGDTDSGCSRCEVGYTLNILTNTCDSAKVSCTNNGDCDSGFRCIKDPECRAYSDLSCADADKVCVTGRRNGICTSDSDCDESNGFGCLDGDIGDGRCVKYQ